MNIVLWVWLVACTGVYAFYLIHLREDLDYFVALIPLALYIPFCILPCSITPAKEDIFRVPIKEKISTSFSVSIILEDNKELTFREIKSQSLLKDATYISKKVPSNIFGIELSDGITYNVNGDTLK